MKYTRAPAGEFTNLLAVRRENVIASPAENYIYIDHDEISATAANRFGSVRFGSVQCTGQGSKLTFLGTDFSAFECGFYA